MMNPELEPVTPSEFSILGKIKSRGSSIVGTVKGFFSCAHDLKHQETSSLDENGLSSHTIDGIHNVHSDAVDENNKVRKELWLGRSLYNHLLDGSFTCIAKHDSDIADTYISEWEGCLLTHKELFPILQSVFTMFQSVFSKKDHLPILRTWMFFLEQQGIERIEDAVIKIESDEERQMFANTISVAEGISSDAEHIIRKAPWILHDGERILVIKRGELEDNKCL